MYIDGIFALSANLLISSTIKFNFKITDKSIITPAVIAIKFANSGLSFFMNKQSMVDIMAIPMIWIISKIPPPFYFSVVS
mgnify:FL=1